MKTGYDLIYTLLSVQRALLGHVSPLLRAVTVDFIENLEMLDLHFFYHGEIDDELFDLASCTCVEADPGTFPYIINEDIVVRVDYPKVIPITGRLVYLRHEPISFEFQQKSVIEYVNIPILPESFLLLLLQEALLGKVTSNMRRINVEIEEENKTLGFYFIFDGAISTQDKELADSAMTEAAKPFHGYHINKYIKRIDFPEPITKCGKRAAYARNEH